MTQFNEYIVIGAGPAALQLGFHFERKNRDYLILERAEKAGKFFDDYPRHRKLLSINKVHTGTDDRILNLRYDWNSLLCDDETLLFKNYSKRYFPDAGDLVTYFGDFAQRYDLKIQYQTEIVTICKDAEGLFVLTDRNGSRFQCRYLVMASGISKTFVPEIPGIEHAEQYASMSLDPEDFVNQRVLIVGMGNSGFETADHLIETAASVHLTAPEPLKLAWKSHHVGHLRAVNNNFLDTYLLKSQNGVFIADILKIVRRDDGKLQVTYQYKLAHDDSGDYVYDRILLCTGFRFDDTIFDEGCKPEICPDSKMPKQDSCWRSVNVPNLYFGGVLMAARDFKKTQSSFIHGFRYNLGALDNMFETNHHGGSWTRKVLARDSDVVATCMLEQFNRATYIWHQPGFLCDIFVDDKANNRILHYPCLPSDYVSQEPIEGMDEYYRITLEYGPDHINFPFDFNRFVDADAASLNPQLHPIVRHYRKGEVVAEHHVLEELEGTWKGPVFTEPLREFMHTQITSAVKV